ncbi:cytokine-dependent hematopoietic cell linker-like [Sorex fumeus]|uniref:cytokine-dependent hematopoietic cell linker-like n=1 Tax=Sorex fumeus TaxID=62283 RepID=UPI0024AE64A5|nr:cytokine-dependent hematopoietic cell linker-like [Sorex fumeus]
MGLMIAPLWAELKIPLIGRVPRAMNRQGNRRTTKEGSSDLKFQNFSLPKNRSWPHISTATGQYQTINEPLLECEGNLGTVLDDTKGCRNEDYEDPELHTVQSWQSVKLSAARLVKESEYADKRYLEDIIETPLSFYTKTSTSMEGQAWKSQMRLEEMNKPIFQDFRGQYVKDLNSQQLIILIAKENPLSSSLHLLERTPLPPPRPPVTLSKRYHPLPPEPDSSGPPLPLRHAVPESRRGPSQINLKNLSEDALHSEWYIGEHSRQAVEEALMKENKDGTFLVRDCSAKSQAEPYVLAVFYGNKVYNVKIRFLELSQQFALGTGLRGEEKFNSVENIIEHYKHSPIILIDGKDKTGVRREQCYLTQPLPLRRHFLSW